MIPFGRNSSAEIPCWKDHDNRLSVKSYSFDGRYSRTVIERHVHLDFYWKQPARGKNEAALRFVWSFPARVPSVPGQDADF